MRWTRTLAREAASIFARRATRPEVGVFTQTSIGRKPVPWGSIAAGETVWMKWSGGPVVAKAVVARFRQLTNCSATDLRTAVAGYNLHDLDDYWSSAPAFVRGDGDLSEK
jgi:hypothetical protein